VSYLHKSRQNAIRQRIQRSNSLISSLYEFGYVVGCGKSQFVRSCEMYVQEAFEKGYIDNDLREDMLRDCLEIRGLLLREKELERAIIVRNKNNPVAQILETIPGIGPINASILSHKPLSSYEKPRDFAASLGLVPRQNTTGGEIKLGSITKQGDRYARTMLIQAGRSLVMRYGKPGMLDNDLFRFIDRLKKGGKGYNVICVAVANKLARIAYGCALKQEIFKV
jgi:transposase